MQEHCDKIIAETRIKYADEIMDEVPQEETIVLSDPNPHGLWDDDKVPLQTYSGMDGRLFNNVIDMFGRLL
ncbi:unnamed protein product [Cochlearia groenlandica]